MNDFLVALKSDLLDRRLRPLLALVGVALLGAIAFAAFGGGSSPSAPAAPASPAPAAAPPSGVTVREANTQTRQPVAETTNGVAQQVGGRTRNPFAAVPGVRTAAPPAGSGASGTPSGEPSKTGTSGAKTEASTKSGATQAPSTSNEKPSPEAQKPAKRQTVYSVTAMFGPTAAGTPPASAVLTPYEGLKRQEPLPSATQPLVVFRGVTAGGKSATFTLVGEAILRGEGACVPDASQCLAIDLKPGQFEELEYVPPGGTAIVYQLQVVKIDASKASAAAARVAFDDESKAGARFLRTAGLAALPGFRYSPDKGVLVFAQRPSLAARARVAAWGASLRG
ncbi:MAG TPA: hypothetical protein VK605_04940 [Solirubrobacteraceae bacterium]|nr:hypothetical protein [Solirubrobacteraceae bacterium]